MDLTKHFGTDGVVINEDYLFQEGKDIQELVNEMRNHGLQVDYPDLTGQLVRVRVGESAMCKADRSNQKSGWYVVNLVGEQHYFATFGNWKTV